jgi:SAM-dependent methyltransferase
VLSLTSPGDAKRLREFLVEAGYTEEHLGLAVGLRDLPSSRLRNLPRLLDLTRSPSRINTLLRWFWVEVPQDASAAAEHVPPWFIAMALECGLLRRHGQALWPEVMLFPTDTFIVAADHPSRIDSADPGLVVWPNPTSRLLSRFTVRRPSRATLDVGTGTGIQALSAAAHSERVLATDLNPRAVEVAAFNARLNGVENVQWRVGNGFEPVADSTFDLIVSNPPFMITPAAQYLFCHNPLDLDQLCRRLVREAPSHLNEGGYFQMLCEWAQVRGQPWSERLTEWFDGTGCDAWAIKGASYDPGEYAEERICSTVSSCARDGELYDSYMAYYRERAVEAIHAGLIAMRRRSGQNWMSLEEAPGTPAEPFGELVVQTFAIRDLLQSHQSDQQLLELRPHLSPSARFEQVFQPVERGWKLESLTLRSTDGFDRTLGLQPLVAEFLRRCDGTRPLDELIVAFAATVDAPVEQVRTECLGAVRKLMDRGFLLYRA